MVSTEGSTGSAVTSWIQKRNNKMRVLVAIEDEQFAPLILDFVAEHQWQAGSILRLITAVEPFLIGDNVTAVYGGGVDVQIMEERVTNASKFLNKCREQLHSKLGGLIPIEVNVIVGQPHHVILDVSDDWKSDLIVMGSHGRTGFSRFLLGSVSLSVVSHANCSVAVVRPAKHIPKKNIELAVENKELEIGANVSR